MLFACRDGDGELVPELEPLVPGAKVALGDGEMTSRYGSRAVAAMHYLRDLFPVR